MAAEHTFGGSPTAYADRTRNLPADNSLTNGQAVQGARFLKAPSAR